MTPDTPEFFQLRPQVEQAFGYSHAVRVGSMIKISGAVSMDAEGAPASLVPGNGTPKPPPQLSANDTPIPSRPTRTTSRMPGMA